MEAAMLGGIFQDPRYLVDVAAITAPAELFLVRNQYILQAMLNVAERGETVDLLSVGEELRAAGQFDAIGGDLYLADLIGACSWPEKTPDYARRVHERAYDRNLLKVADDLRKLALNGAMSNREKRGQAEALVTGADGLAADESMVFMADLMRDYLKDMAATVNLPPGVSGLRTGFNDYDVLLDGLQPDSLNFVGGVPGTGKTSFLIVIALFVAVMGGRVYFWSGEMSRRQIRERLMSIRSHIRADLLRKGLRRGGMDQDQWKLFTRQANSLADLKIVVDDAEDMTPALLLSHVDIAARRFGGLDLILIDYIGLMEPGVKKENRDKELGFISRKLKRSVAKRAPVLCAAQLNRSLEKREDKRPRRSDLRDSGNLEADADTFTGLYRDVMYNDECEFPNRCDVILDKNRHGPTGTTHLHFEESLTLFTDARTVHVDLRGL